MITFLFTVAAIVFVASLFLSQILGVFGLAATSVAALQKLQVSQQIVEKMQNKHSARKLRVSKKFARKAGKRVASTALAAATVGTAAVAVAMIGIEADDYCAEKKELQQDGDLLYGTETKFDADNCVDEARQALKAIAKEAIDAVPEVVSDAIGASAEYSAEAWAAAKEASTRAIQSGSEETSRRWESARSWLLD